VQVFFGSRSTKELLPRSRRFLQTRYFFWMSSEQKPITLVVGATGRTGQAVVHYLLKKNFSKNQIRILARNIDSAKKLFGEEVEIYQGNVASLDAVKPAIKDVTHVFYLTGPTYKSSRQEVEQCLVWGLRNIVNEGKKLGTLRHVILLSSIGLDRPYWIFTVLLNMLIPGLAISHLAQERLLRESGLNYTILRPPVLGEVATIPEEVKITNGRCQGYSISRAALGDFMVRCIENPVLPAKTTLEIWGLKKKATEDFKWNTLFSKVQADFDDLPPNLEKAT